MKKLLKLLILICLPILAIVRCGEQSPDSDCHEGSKLIPVESFQPNLDCSIITDLKNDQNFVINSKEEYNTLVYCADSIPAIDFQKSTLLTGKKELTWCCTKLIEQELIKDCDSKNYVYKVVLNEPDGKYHSLSTFYYYALAPKIESDYEVIFEIIMKEQ